MHTLINLPQEKQKSTEEKLNLELLVGSLTEERNRLSYISLYLYLSS